MKRLLGILLTCAFAIALSGSSNAQSVNVDMSMQVQTTVQYFEGDQENYVDWGENRIVVYGYGFVPTNYLNSTPAAQRAGAKRMAEANSQKLLLEKCKGVNVVNDTVVSGTELYEHFTSHSEGFIDSISYESYTDNGASDLKQLEVRVKAVALLYGKTSSYAAAVLPYVASKQEPLASTSIYTSASFAANITVTADNRIQPFTPVGSPVEPPPTVTQTGPFTGLIVDGSGLGLRPAMSPNVLDPQSKNVYGFIKVDAETVIDYGICGYARSMDQARKNARAGTNPIVVKGIQKRGNFEADVVISTAEAQKVIDATKAYDFLARLKVVIVY